MAATFIAENFSFGGRQIRAQHFSVTLNCEMNFSIYLPPQAQQQSVPVLYWLSGLTCTDENFVQKAGAQRAASHYGIAIVAPDTSPRGEGIADDPDGAYDFGLGAGFYVNASEPPFAAHYQMYDYITTELPGLIEDQFPIDSNRQSIFGHSMGGHGALTIALKNPQRFKSVSAFAPICAPMQCAWGQKALQGYLGSDQATWRAYDTCALLEDGAHCPPALVDQGEADEFLENQLKPDLLQNICETMGQPLELRYQAGYDHSYFFIASFMDEHIAFHAKQLLT